MFYFSARRICIRKLQILGCDDGILEDRRGTKLSQGKGPAAGLEDCQNNETGIFLARTSLASREPCYAAGALGLGTQQKPPDTHANQNSFSLIALVSPSKTPPLAHSLANAGPLQLMSATHHQVCVMVLGALFTLRPGPRIAQKMRSPCGQLRF